MNFDVVTFGDVVADLLLPIPRLPLVPQQHQLAHEFAIEPGGIGNYLVMAQRLGLRCAAIDTLGDDEFGRRIEAALRHEGVNTSALNLGAGTSTALAAVIVDDAAQHVFLGIPGSAAAGVPSEPQDRMIRNARAFYTNGYSLLARQSNQAALVALRAARMAGVLVVFDPGPLIGNVGEESVREALSNTDVLLLTLEEARMLVKAAVADQAARQLLDCGPRLIGLKLGEDGCLLANREGVQRFEPFRVDCRDTCGAGDAFDAACTFGLLRGMPLSRLGILANAVGAATVAVLGSGTRLPGRSAILNLVRDSAARSFASDDVDAIVSSLEAR